VLQFLLAINAEKQTTILLATHNLSDVEQICPRIMIIDHGKVVLDEPQDEILRRFGKQRILVVEFSNGVKDLHIPKGRIVKQEENKLWIEFNRDEVSGAELIALWIATRALWTSRSRGRYRVDRGSNLRDGVQPS
jgi:ABC-2 type transport system ATP-binding protein